MQIQIHKYNIQRYKYNYTNTISQDTGSGLFENNGIREGALLTKEKRANLYFGKLFFSEHVESF